MYFLNAPRTLCHILEDMRTGKAPDPCGAKAHKTDILRYQKGEPNKLLKVKPQDIPLCKHCQKGAAGLAQSARHLKYQNSNGSGFPTAQASHSNATKIRAMRG